MHTETSIAQPSPGLAGRTWRPDGEATDRFGPSLGLGGLAATGRLFTITRADTWYPSSYRDGAQISPWTDGSVGGWACASQGHMAATAYARITGTPPNLTVEPLGSRFGNPLPYLGRYPSGGFIADGTWYAGTYCLNQADASRNLDVLGPFVGFDATPDQGTTWWQGRRTPADPLFGEDPRLLPVRIGAPHAVDFGRELEHSPDGRAYFVAHGSADDQSHGSWITGDAIYLLRAIPGWPAINEIGSWEFFAGLDSDGSPRWSARIERLAPVLHWPAHLGCVTAVWAPALARYLLFTTDGGDTVSTMNSMVFEAEQLHGPWRVLADMPNFGQQGYFLNAPSAYHSADGRRFWLWYSANFTNGIFGAHGSKPAVTANPAGSGYALCMLELDVLPPCRPGHPLIKPNGSFRSAPHIHTLL